VMPIYEYKCPKCNKTKEVIRRMDEQDPELCPECETEMVRVPVNYSFKI